MRKTYFLVSLLSFVIAILLGGCGSDLTKRDSGEQQTVSRAESAALERKEAVAGTRIKMSFDGKEAIAELYDNPTSRDFAAMLPVTFRFKDYNGTEKIADPPRALSLEKAPKGFAPSAGDLTLFAPWGNLAIFYRDFRYSEGLVSIGRLTSGMETLANMKEDFTVHIELIHE